VTTLVIHDFRKDYFDLNLVAYSLTFDDGLYSQYYYYPLLGAADNPKIFFIITSFIKPGKARKQFKGEFIKAVKSRKYMHAAFIEHDYSQFMTLEEIQELATHKDVKIGTHSHFHDVIIHDSPPKKPTSQWKIERLSYHPEKTNPATSIRSSLAFQGLKLKAGKLVPRKQTEWLDYIKYDTESSLQWFDENLGYVPDIYGLPFNEYSGTMLEVLESFGFKEFYGKPGKNNKIHGRLDIDKLAQKGSNLYS
jgi:hypothetical protein